MHRRRAALLALALTIAVPLAPARAADPTPAPIVVPAADPTASPTVGPSASPSGAPASPAPAAPAPAAPTASPDAGTSPEPADLPAATPAELPADPSTGPSAAPAVAPSSGGPSSRATGGLDATNRWIVVLRNGASLSAVRDRATSRLGVKAERSFERAFRGFSAVLSPAQAVALRSDADVAALVPDEIVSVAAQYTPLGVRRIGGTRSPAAVIDGIDTRVDADVAIVDTGIDPSHPDLNVAGGYNCSTADRKLWRDVQNHGTHVAGTVGAIDNGSGVVGVAPGARLWAVKILNDDGFGYLSWYVCGLDWITAQRDPADPSRPLFEAVNMSVAKPGRDDKACGAASNDILHAAICRLVGSGVTVVAAAGNDASTASTLVPAAYDEVITVSALADSDGKSGGLGGNLCYSWGTYDRDDTLADFSNYGWDVDLIAPGKCIWSTLPGNRYGYSSGTSMAAPHVTGAVALYKATRPLATPAQVKAALQELGNLNWNTATDRDSYHEKLLDVSRIVPLGDFGVDAGDPPDTIKETGGTLTLPVTIVRSEGFFEAVSLDVQAPAGIAATLSTASLAGDTAVDAQLTVSVPRSTPSGTYEILVSARNWDRVRTTTATITVEGDAPVAVAPLVAAATGSTFNTSTLLARAMWAPATDATSAIAGYELQWSVDGGTWGDTVSLPAATRAVNRYLLAGHTYAARVRARDTAGNWGAWAAASPYRFVAIQNTSTAMKRAGTWYRAYSTTQSGGSSAYSTARGASITVAVTGRGFALVMPKGPTRGQARIYVDGVLVSTMSLYRSSTRNRQVVLSRAFATSQTHTVKVVVVGTAGRPRIDVDAIVVLR